MQTFRPTLRQHDVTDQQWRVIRALAETKEMEVLELATKVFIQASSLSRILPSLEARNLCSRRAVPSDLRKALISLTDEGRALVAELGLKFEEAYAFIEESYGAEKLQRLLEMSQELEAVLQAARSETSATSKSEAASEGS